MLRNLSALSVFLSLLFISSCDLIPQQKYVPKHIKAFPNIRHSGIEWGVLKAGDAPKISADIDTVKVECIPIETQQDKSSSKIQYLYEIAVTADISFNIKDQKYFNSLTLLRNFETNIVFEAITANGVALGEARGIFRLIRGGNVSKVSTKIVGLTLEEIKRVDRVEARWEY